MADKKRKQAVYTLLVEVGRKAGDGLPADASGAALMCYASGVDEAEAVRETVAILKQADMAPLDVSGYGTLEERRELGHEIPEEEIALMQRAADEISVIVAQGAASENTSSSTVPTNSRCPRLRGSSPTSSVMFRRVWSGLIARPRRFEACSSSNRDWMLTWRAELWPGRSPARPVPGSATTLSRITSGSLLAGATAMRSTVPTWSDLVL